MARDRGEPQPPPADLAERLFPLASVPAGGWTRIHRATREGCFYSERPSNRFSSPGVGMLYLADAAVTAFWETYWDDLGTRAPDDRRIGRTRLSERVVRGVAIRRALQVFDARDARSLRVVGAPTGTFSSSYVVCQAWARALAQHPSKPDAILYPSARNARGRCLALFAARTSCDDLAFDAPTRVGESVELLRALLAEGVDVLAD